MRPLSRLMRDCEGAAAVEFSLLGPMMITMMLAVLQIGMAMMSYNTLRSVASDAARYTVINYQTNNKVTESQIGSVTRAIATTGAYNLDGSRLNITVVKDMTNQRVVGAAEFSLTIAYRVPTLLSIVGLSDIPMTYSRPIFVLP